MRKIVWRAVATVATVACFYAAAHAQQGHRRITVEFSGGLNLRDDPAVLGLINDSYRTSYATDGYNFRFTQDGLAHKRPGLSVDVIGATDSTIDFFGVLPLNITDGTTGSVLVHADTAWLVRPLGSTTYSTIRTPSTLDVTHTGYTASTLFGSELFVASTAWPMFRFNGDTVLYRVAVEDIIDQNPATIALLDTTDATSQLDSTTTYWYTHAYIVNFPYEGYRLQEGPRSTALCTTTTNTRRVISYTVPQTPMSIDSADVDALQFTGINIYRSVDGALFDWITTLPYGPNLTESERTFVDNGKLTTNAFQRGWPPQIFPDNHRSLAAFNDFLFSLSNGRDVLWTATTYATEETASGDNYTYTFAVWGDADGSMTTNSWDLDAIRASLAPEIYTTASRTVGGTGPANVLVGDADEDATVATTDVNAIWNHLEGTTPLTGDGLLAADVNNDGSVTTTDAYYLSSWLLHTGRGGTTDIREFNADVNTSGTVTQADVDAISTVLTTATASTYDMTYTPFTTANVQPGDILYSTSGSRYTIHAVPSDSQLTLTTALDADDYLTTLRTFSVLTESTIDRGMYVYKRNAPIVDNWDQAYTLTTRQSDFTRLIASPSALYILSPNGIWEVAPFFHTTDIIPQSVDPTASLTSPGAATTYRGGVLFADHSAVRYLRGAYTTQNLSEIVGSIDSLTTLLTHDDCLYADAGQYTWVYDLNRDIWTRYTGWNANAWGVWTDSTTPRLFHADSRAPNVYRVDATRTADLDITGADSTITASLSTPRYNYGDRGAWFEEFRLTIDTADTVRVSFELSDYDSVYTITAAKIDPAVGDSSFTPGIPFTRILPIRASAQSCRVTVWTRGTSRCIIYPSTLVTSDPMER